MRDGLISYSSSYSIYEELDYTNLQFNPIDNPHAFLELRDSIPKCLAVATAIKITEIINCFGCREAYQAPFMHHYGNKNLN